MAHLRSRPPTLGQEKQTDGKSKFFGFLFFFEIARGILGILRQNGVELDIFAAAFLSKAQFMKNYYIEDAHFMSDEGRWITVMSTTAISVTVMFR